MHLALLQVILGAGSNVAANVGLPNNSRELTVKDWCSLNSRITTPAEIATPATLKIPCPEGANSDIEKVDDSTVSDTIQPIQTPPPRTKASPNSLVPDERWRNA